MTNREMAQKIYMDFLIEKRQLDLQEENETVKCANCGREKSEHPLHDPRCSINALSQKFRSANGSRLEETNKALVLLEELLKILT